MKLGDRITEEAVAYAKKLEWAYEEMGEMAPSIRNQRINAYRAGAEMALGLNHAELVEEALKLRMFIADVLQAVRLQTCPTCHGEWSAPMNGRSEDCSRCEFGFVPRPGGDAAVDSMLAKHGKSEREIAEAIARGAGEPPKRGPKT